MEAPETRQNAPEPLRTATQIEHALKTVIAAAASAERFATEIGYSQRRASGVWLTRF